MHTMALKRSGSLIALFLLSIMSVFLLGSPARATTTGVTVTGSITAPGTPGVYELRVTGCFVVGDVYPPTSVSGGSLAISDTVVFPGQTIFYTVTGVCAGTSLSVSVVRIGDLSAESGTLRIALLTTTRTLTARFLVVAPGGGGVAGPAAGPTIIVNNSSSSSSSAAASATGAVAAAAPQATVVRVLARTGVDALPLLAAAAATILLGSVMLSAGRRRERQAQSLAG